jgi:hypothetical protein
MPPADTHDLEVSTYSYTLRTIQGIVSEDG